MRVSVSSLNELSGNLLYISQADELHLGRPFAMNEACGIEWPLTTLTTATF